MEIDYSKEQCFKMLATKEIAQEWLNHNRCNRSISDRYVNNLISDMRKGKWVVNGATIVFSKEGELLDGQHRLTAIVRSGISEYVYIMTGLDRTCHFDDGRKRTIRDQILAMGMAQKNDAFSDNKCIASVRFLYAWDKTGSCMSGHAKPSTEEVFYWMVGHEDAVNFIHKLGNKNYGTVNCRSAFILAAVLLARLNGISEETLTEWFRVVRTGEYSNDLHISAIAFRNWLINMKRGISAIHDGFLKAQHSIKCFGKRKVKILQTKQVFPFEWKIEEEN